MGQLIRSGALALARQGPWGTVIEASPIVSLMLAGDESIACIMLPVRTA
jgi:hypothetical protein